MSMMTKEDEVVIYRMENGKLKREIAQLEEQLKKLNDAENCYCSYCMTSEVMTWEKLQEHINKCEKHPMFKLKEQLRREVECVDFYADRENWLWLNKVRRNFMKKDLEHDINFTSMTAGKLARETQQQRNE